MSEKENLHAGHRQRLVDRFIDNPNAVSTHELLEIFLFPFIPRKNTNDIAHRLLKTFGSLNNIFSASAKDLMAVEGVGKTTATNLVVSGKMFKLLYEEMLKASKPIVWRNFGLDKNAVIECFQNCINEIFLLVLLDKNHREITRIVFEDNQRLRVSADVPELTKAIAVNKPYAVLIAHNHPSGNPDPSHDDDTATAKIYMVCNLHGVEFADHVIVAKNTAFSYRGSGRLYYIEENYNVNKIFDQIDKIKE